MLQVPNLVKSDLVFNERLTEFSVDIYSDCLSFFAEIYLYLKTSNGKKIDYGLRNPEGIKKIEAYELPSDDELLMQSINSIICETCFLNEQCYGGYCLRNKDELKAIRKDMMKIAKSK